MESIFCGSKRESLLMWVRSVTGDDDTEESRVE